MTTDLKQKIQLLCEFDGSIARKAFHKQKSSQYDDAHSFEEGARYQFEKIKPLLECLVSILDESEKAKSNGCVITNKAVIELIHEALAAIQEMVGKL